jgi:hypothetical protein
VRPNIGPRGEIFYRSREKLSISSRAEVSIRVVNTRRKWSFVSFLVCVLFLRSRRELICTAL